MISQEFVDGEAQGFGILTLDHGKKLLQRYERDEPISSYDDELAIQLVENKFSKRL